MHGWSVPDAWKQWNTKFPYFKVKQNDFYYIFGTNPMDIHDLKVFHQNGVVFVKKDINKQIRKMKNEKINEEY